MNVLDLFSGIGGFSLGLERAGFNTVAFCEIDKSAQKVLKKHWPNVPIFDDVTSLTKEALDDAGCKDIGLICGGFPCQDISISGKQAGIEGERSGLWKQFKRRIRELKPDYVIIENVAALRSNGLVTVLQDLWKIGYDAEWHIISASSIGAPHRRERIWIIAYPICQGLQRPVIKRASICIAKGKASIQFGNRIISCGSGWEHGPNLRMGNGVSTRLDKNRIKQLGNSVIPQIPELLGRAILQYEEERKARIRSSSKDSCIKKTTA